MDKAISTLQQRFTEPSADILQQNPLCGICWNEYEGEDRPVTLPCGHVFGEECILAWSRGITPTGRHNGCPCCRAELLPPSFHSRTSALCYWGSDIWRTLGTFVAEPRKVVLATMLWVVRTCARWWPESKVAGYMRFGADLCFILLMMQLYASIVGWRLVVLYTLAINPVVILIRLIWQDTFS